MRLRIVTPIRVELDTPVTGIVAEAPNGAFGLLPRHVDFVSQLITGILSYQSEDGPEAFAALNGGTLVKLDDIVTVTTRNAILGRDLNALQQKVRDEFHHIGEHEREARAALARLEAGMVRRFIELEKAG
jgi:F-type H+-transporting ATPase subunit epsilon